MMTKEIITEMRKKTLVPKQALILPTPIYLRVSRIFSIRNQL
ncbi:hypothetical protein [Bacillus yapensis]|nr:hypothetical protein [Bacillus yapensis]